MKKNLFLFILLLCFTSYAAEKYKADVLFINGATANGYAELPSNKTTDGAINLSESKNGKSTRYKFEDIDKIVYHTDSGNKFLFVRSKIRQVWKTKRKTKERVRQFTQWHVLVSSTPYISMYYMGDKFYIDDNDNIVAVATQNSFRMGTIIVSFKRPEEELVTQIAIQVSGTFGGQGKMFRQITAAYFSDVPELVQRIENKEFRVINYREVFEAYVQYKEKE